jgi:hypothetical protein
VLAAKPHPLLRFHLHHLEQTAEQIELVALRQPDQIGDGLRNILASSGPPSPGGSSVGGPPSLVKNCTQCRVL